MTKSYNINDIPPELVPFFSPYIPELPEKSVITGDSSCLTDDNTPVFIYLRQLNYHIDLQKCYSGLFESLQVGGFFVGCVESLKERRKSFYRDRIYVTGLIKHFSDFTLHRFLYKFNIFKKFYHQGKSYNRAISLTETLGRLTAAGFQVLDHKEIDNLTWFIARKENEAMPPSPQTQKFIYKMARTGKNGKTIYVYKLRTMHPFANYIRDYLYQRNGLENGVKIKDDFRITGWGKIFRKFWIDELPMLWNLLKGDIKIVGIRPVGSHFLSLTDESYRSYRRRFKPGLLPPYYVDLPSTFDEVIQSEKKYLGEYEKHPLKTDIKYFFKALKNIFVGRRQSQ